MIDDFHAVESHAASPPLAADSPPTTTAWEGYESQGKAMVRQANNEPPRAPVSMVLPGTQGWHFWRPQVRSATVRNSRSTNVQAGRQMGLMRARIPQRSTDPLAHMPTSWKPPSASVLLPVPCSRTTNTEKKSVV